MKISELSRESGVPLATVKFYLREGLLPPGERVAATQADYGPEHLARLRLVRALVEVAGLSLASTRAVLAAMQSKDLLSAAGLAHAALPPEPADDVEVAPARRLVQRAGWSVDADTPALRQLATALATAEQVGMLLDDDTLDTYAAAAASVAEVDVAGVPVQAAEEAVAHVVLGTILYEPVLLALRRLAQQSLAREAW